MDRAPGRMVMTSRSPTASRPLNRVMKGFHAAYSSPAVRTSHTWSTGAGMSMLCSTIFMRFLSGGNVSQVANVVRAWLTS